ncbi:uncharacterized protein LOC108675923 [Hyalella azteca]|uniref:Uncharacterized protein LOC108675923 n=1 Tax=Hyalella azteca TaxID=294128 RepID=A0A8B7P0D1_HYAAZ|nr:uncharacterized protein LOC108675923 [Hyalella azteca]
MIKMIDKNINDISLVKAVVLENNLMLKDISKKETVAPFPRPTFCPAKTLDELQTLMTRSDLIPILVTSKDSTLNKTATSMLKLLLTRELALAFSMTGLGLRRQRTKMKFDNSPSCLAIERALSQIPDYSQVPRCEVKTAIRLALKGAIDWSGQRGKRKDATGAAINLKTNQENALTPSRPEGSTARVLNSSHIAGEAVATSSRTAVNPSHTQTTGWDTFDAGPSWSTSEEMLLDAGSFVPPRDDVHDMVDNFPQF